MNMNMMFPMNFNMNPKFSGPPKNNYLKPFVTLERYDDEKLIKKSLEACSNINDAEFDIDRIQNAQFFILRSTNDDDLHKVSFNFQISKLVFPE